MDYIDKVTFLKAKFQGSRKKSEVDELVKQLEIATMLITSTESGATYSDSDRDFIETAIDNAEKAIGRNAEDMLTEIVSTGQIPRELYNDDLPGAIPLDRVNDIPHFQVRGKSYMADGKKITSGAPLFFLRAMQVVKVRTFSRNVAMEDWCGYPKHAHENEWLLLNYMVSDVM
ncbi:DUF1336 domain-containing protein [archaeon]|nr:MAG: DUF1336 domain-containing protein [archaeon]